MRLNIIILSHAISANSCFLTKRQDPVETGRKLNGCLRNVLCTFSLRPVSTGGGSYRSLILGVLDLLLIQRQRHISENALKRCQVLNGHKQ